MALSDPLVDTVTFERNARTFRELGLQEPICFLAREGDTRKRILEAALELFATIGFDATPVDMIVSKSETSPNTLYRQFECKSGLLNELYRILQLEFRSYFSEIGMEDIGTNISFIEVVRRWFAYAIYRPHRHDLLFVRDLSMHLDERNRARLAEFQEGSERFYQKGQQGRHLRPGDPALLRAAIEGCLNGVLAQINRGKLELNKDTFELALKVAWDSIRY
ncbi:TetR/AcrR family transcriptional regulator [Pelagicoccus sp. SDUM812003]|uniref:TetR/AcrR family transcriptional regulator n=1 Tax=Pelagicoccus sp. SDUM812003 TaxID=3041267 RepID=UPI00280E51A4|nr:TetR/AcrR family transcriptional regulator [Pelagicoccus sp. SDUM812003]MDQ8205453.1 TetR/AcrR family transcriptional regulator [Pelagicoccus sp. SDUM812003]